MWQQEEPKYILDANGKPFNNVSESEDESIFNSIVKCINPDHDKLIAEINNLKHKLRQCEVIANNVLYFDDNSDYTTALWQVLNVTQGRKIHDDCYDLKLTYMEE